MDTATGSCGVCEEEQKVCFGVVVFYESMRQLKIDGLAREQRPSGRLSAAVKGDAAVF